ncbi:MAG: hypothetical protein B6D41_22090 [Chloroflexi bacterium UTCFX4]|jgi:hypothetical protein|nr:MAG: hypothetical protein B6D41_22090 [Chloroflexi bacterium UTCFX4]
MSETIRLPESLPETTQRLDSILDAKPAVQHDDLMERIEQLAFEIRSFDESSADVLELLSEHLGEERAFDPLWGMNLYSVLNPDALEQRAAVYYRERPDILNWFEVARNLLVLVPIIITWAGLYIASNNYAETLRLHPDLEGVPFLLLWEQGFPEGIATWLRFSHIAALDFGIILLILLLTFIYHYHAEVQTHHANQRAQALRLRLERVLWEINLIFARRYMVRAPDSLLGQLAGIVQDIRAERQHLAQMSAQATDAYAGITDLREKFSEFSLDLARQQAQVLNSVTTNIQNLANAAATIQGALREISENINRSGAATEAAAGELTTVSSRMVNMVGQLAAVARDMQNAVVAVGTTVDVMQQHVHNEADLYEAFHKIAQAFPERQTFEAVNQQLAQQNANIQAQLEHLRRAQSLSNKPMDNAPMLQRFVNWLVALFALTAIGAAAIGLNTAINPVNWILLALFVILLFMGLSIGAFAMARLR